MFLVDLDALVRDAGGGVDTGLEPRWLDVLATDVALAVGPPIELVELVHDVETRAYQNMAQRLVDEVERSLGSAVGWMAQGPGWGLASLELSELLRAVSVELFREPRSNRRFVDGRACCGRGCGIHLAHLKLQQFLSRVPHHTPQTRDAHGS